MSKIELGRPMPNWFLKAVFDEEIPDLSDFKGKPLLVLFFNLGCAGCVGRAVPFANRVVYENEKNINVIGIHTRFEGSKVPIETIKQAKEDYYIRFKYFEDKEDNKTYKTYEAGGTPHWLLINADGTLEYSIFGSDPNNALLRLDLKIKEVLDSEN